MADRFILYDALHALNQGCILHIGGETAFAHYLEGCPDICFVAQRLIDRQWVAPRLKDKTQYVITEAGRAVFAQGAARYRTFPWYKRLLGRAVFCNFDWPAAPTEPF